MKNNMHQRGFTFIELMVTLAIIAILALVVIPMAEVRVQRDKERALAMALAELRGAIDQYKRASDAGQIAKDRSGSGYPRRLEDLVSGATDATSLVPRKLYFLRRIPRDPFCEDEQLDASACWFKRSYSSPPDAPAEGEDVFDVSTRSERVALNGVRLKEW